MAGCRWTSKLLLFNSSNVNYIGNINYLSKVSKNLRHFPCTSTQLRYKCGSSINNSFCVIRTQSGNQGNNNVPQTCDTFKFSGYSGRHQTWTKSYSTTVKESSSTDDENNTSKNNTKNTTTTSSSSSREDEADDLKLDEISDDEVYDDNSGPIEVADDCEEFTLWLSDDDIHELSQGCPDIVKQIRYFQLEHEVLRQEGFLVPTKAISVRKWEELLKLGRKSARKRYYEYLFKAQMSHENDKKRKEERKIRREQELAALPPVPPLGEDPDGMIYGLNRNTLWLRLRENTVHHHFHSRLIQEMRFGQTFVIDCGYDDRMSPKEAKNCAKQLEYLFSFNRFHPHPFNLHIVNAHRNDQVIKHLERFIPGLYDADFPILISEKNYTEIFPRNKLVYLTPHAKDEIFEINEDEIYIMGAIVDKTDTRPFSLAKAKKEGLRMAKLPLDRYLDWGLGDKILTLNQINAIMLDARYYKDWNVAFKHVPRRKLKNWGYPTQEGNPEVYRRNDLLANARREHEGDRSYHREPEFERSGFRKSIVNAPYVTRRGDNSSYDNNNYSRDYSHNNFDDNTSNNYRRNKNYSSDNYDNNSNSNYRRNSNYSSDNYDNNSNYRRNNNYSNDDCYNNNNNNNNARKYQNQDNDYHRDGRNQNNSRQESSSQNKGFVRPKVKSLFDE